MNRRNVFKSLAGFAVGIPLINKVFGEDIETSEIDHKYVAKKPNTNEILYYPMPSDLDDCWWKRVDEWFKEILPKIGRSHNDLRYLVGLPGEIRCILQVPDIPSECGNITIKDIMISKDYLELIVFDSNWNVNHRVNPAEMAENFMRISPSYVKSN